MSPSPGTAVGATVKETSQTPSSAYSGTSQNTSWTAGSDPISVAVRSGPVVAVTSCGVETRFGSCASRTVSVPPSQSKRRYENRPALQPSS